MLMLSSDVSSENKARPLLRHVQLCLGFFYLAVQRASQFCRICIHFTLLWKQYCIDAVSFDCVYDCIPKSSNHPLMLYAECFYDFIIPAVTGTNQQFTKAWFNTHASKTTTTNVHWQIFPNRPVRPYSPLSGFQRSCACRWYPNAPAATCKPCAYFWGWCFWYTKHKTRPRGAGGRWKIMKNRWWSPASSHARPPAKAAWCW